MGGALAENFARWLKLNKIEREILVISGISAGFSSVFGTPLAGTLFGLEVLAIGKSENRSTVSKLFAALFANFVTESFNVKHTHYQMGAIPAWDPSLFFKLLLCGHCIWYHWLAL